MGASFITSHSSAADRILAEIRRIRQLRWIVHALSIKPEFRMAGKVISQGKRPKDLSQLFHHVQCFVAGKQQFSQECIGKAKSKDVRYFRFCTHKAVEARKSRGFQKPSFLV